MGAVDKPRKFSKESNMKRETGMSRTVRTIALSLGAVAVLGLSAGGIAHAARGDGGCGGQAMMSGKAPGSYMGKRLDDLHKQLKLTPEQEPAWKAWVGSMPMPGKAGGMQAQRPDFAELAKLPAPERMARMLERHKERQQEMDASLTALRDFYGKLTPEQQKSFDKFHPFGDNKRGGRHHGPQQGMQRGMQQGNG